MCPKKSPPNGVFGIILLLLTAVIGLTIGCTQLYNENEDLRKTEWFYRGQRNGHISEEAQKLLMNREKSSSPAASMNRTASKTTSATGSMNEA